jgi:tRNA(fMet)-specific endonuclease VapC
MVKQADHSESFLLDSSACILVLRGQASFKALPPCDQTSISSIVAAELWTGAEKSGNPIRFRQLEDLFSIYRVLDFGSEAARAYAVIRVELEKKGTPIGPMDLLIAAHSRQLGSTLVTCNGKEFKRVKGLKVLELKK